MSSRWLAVAACNILRKCYPNVPGAANFAGGKDWRRRFARRHGVGVRKKSNVKNKRWEDTEPVLLRYFAGVRKRVRGEDWVPPPQTDQVEPEPPDENPEPELEGDAAEDGAEDDTLVVLDEEDNAVEDDELQAFEMPEAGVISPAPSEEELEFKNPAGLRLMGRTIYFNWAAIGWCAGDIMATNTDGRKKVKGDAANFVAWYKVDGEEAVHSLKLANYGCTDKAPKDCVGSWVLLQ